VCARSRYDCGGGWGISCEDLFHAPTGQMQLYDIGMSSMFVSETDALIELASLLGPWVNETRSANGTSAGLAKVVKQLQVGHTTFETKAL
jgi:hypothetical protein